MDRLDSMRMFLRVAELGSFSAVAQQMDLARSVVTRQIAALETHLGVKLIARSTRRLSLTAAGAAYVEKCRVILNLVDEAETGLADDRHALRGSIRISAPLSFGLKTLAPLLLDFVAAHPGVVLDMDYSDRRVNLIEEAIDLAIRITGKLNPSDVARRLGTIRMSVVASPDYLARHGEPRHPSELLNHECLGYTLVPLATWQFVVDGQVQGFPIRSRIQANNGDVLLEAAARGFGITCHPTFVTRDAVAAGRVREILTGYAIPELGLYAVLPGNRHIPHRIRVLTDFLAQRLAEPGTDQSLSAAS
jgi:DNA-binding transcriptional LysR family regulator